MKRRSARAAGNRKRSPARATSRRRRAKPARERRASWARRVEAATLQRRPADVDGAIRAFDALPLSEQITLVREIADTRAAELTRAYADLVAVAYGFRRSRDRATGVSTVERTPCVKLLVKRKREARAVDPRRLVPERLFAYATLEGTRRLCAAPTDVEDARDHARARPHASRRVLVATSATGVLTCAIERSGEPGVPYVVSCRHVLGVRGGADAEVTLVGGNGQRLATAVDVAGVLDDAASISLDCQIARVDHRPTARLALGHDVEVAMESADDALLLEHVYVMTPSGSIEASVNAIRHSEHPIDYGPGRGREIRHETLLEVQTERPTRGGDSGSAVLTDREGGLLVGMLIAGPPNTAAETPGSLSYVIPAAHVLDAARYEGSKLGERWRLVRL